MKGAGGGAGWGGGGRVGGGLSGLCWTVVRLVTCPFYFCVGRRGSA